MISFAFNKETGHLIKSKNVIHPKKIQCYCYYCHEKLSYVKKNNILDGSDTETYFIHNNNDKNKYVSCINNNKYMYFFINKWLKCIKPKYKYINKSQTDIVDVINTTNQIIYIKYLLLSREFIESKINDNNKLIWLLSIYSGSNSDKKSWHPRACEIYNFHEVDNNKLICFKNECDINNFDLCDCFVYFDDGINIYKLVCDKERKYYTFDRKAVRGYILKIIPMEKFVGKVFNNITNEIPQVKDDHNNNRKTVYTEDEINKIKIINEITDRYNELVNINCEITYDINYDLNDIVNNNYYELSILRQNILGDIDKKKLIRDIYINYCDLLRKKFDTNFNTYDIPQIQSYLYSEFNTDDIALKSHRALSKILKHIEKKQLREEICYDYYNLIQIVPGINFNINYISQKKIKIGVLLALHERIKLINNIYEKQRTFLNSDIGISFDIDNITNDDNELLSDTLTTMTLIMDIYDQYCILICTGYDFNIDNLIQTNNDKKKNILERITLINEINSLYDNIKNLKPDIDINIDNIMKKKHTELTKLLKKFNKFNINVELYIKTIDK